MLNFKTFGTKRPSKRSAFTLIELSIVLIIIGLLVAGVTGGASLIKSAQLRALMSETIGYKVAVNSFNAIYDEMPGDYGVVIGAGIAGDQDGNIEYLAGQGAGNGSIMEGPSAWHHLIDSGTIDDSLTINTGTLAPADLAADVAHAVATNMPDSKLDGVGFMFDNSTAGNVLVITGDIATVVVEDSTVLTNLVATGVLTGIDALSIDAKLDDSIANTGEVRGSALLATAANCFTTTVYDTTDTDLDCALEVTVDL
jgi:prepilin-type N-terminal cleavage/methylation domain-containing protein